MSQQPRIVITGMGIASPLGCGIEPVWQRLLAGKSGLRRLPEEMVKDLPAKVGGVVPSIEEDAEAGLNADAVVSTKDQRKMDRSGIACGAEKKSHQNRDDGRQSATAIYATRI